MITPGSTTVHVDEVYVQETSEATAHVHVAETSSNTVRDAGVCVYTCAHAICTII